jgi:hypothetical protein
VTVTTPRPPSPPSSPSAIRTFPWQRRHRAIAANLLLDTRQRLTRARHRTRNEIPTGTDPHAGPHDRDHPHPGGIDTTETTLVLRDLLTWAHRNQVLNPFEIRLLIASHVHDIPVDHLAVVYGRSRSHLYAARALAIERLRRAVAAGRAPHTDRNGTTP